MPKIERPRPKYGLKRYSPPSTTNARAAAASAQGTIVQQTSHFLNLPVEIRLRIYTSLVEPYLDPEVDLTQISPETTPAPRRELFPLLSVCRQLSEEWVPFYYSGTCVANDCWRKPGDLDTLYLKTLDTYKLRNIRYIAHNASSEDRKCPAFPDARAFASVIAKYAAALESLQTVAIIAAHANMLFYTWTDNLASKPERAAKKLWKIIEWSQEWEDLARSLQGKTRAGALRGWDLSKHLVVSTSLNTRGDRIYRPIGAKLEWNKPENLEGLAAEEYELIVIERDPEKM